MILLATWYILSNRLAQHEKQQQLTPDITTSLGTTVFRGLWNFKPGCGICHFPGNFDISEILQKLRNELVRSSAID